MANFFICANYLLHNTRLSQKGKEVQNQMCPTSDEFEYAHLYWDLYETEEVSNINFQPCLGTSAVWERSGRGIILKEWVIDDITDPSRIVIWNRDGFCLPYQGSTISLQQWMNLHDLSWFRELNHWTLRARGQLMRTNVDLLGLKARVLQDLDVLRRAGELDEQAERGLRNLRKSFKRLPSTRGGKAT